MARDKADKTDATPLATPATTATLTMTLIVGAHPWSFERAQAYAKGRLAKAKHMTDEKQWLDPTHSGLTMLASDPQALMKDARLKAGVFDALCFAIAHKMERNEPLSDDVKAWAASFLRGEIEPPIRKSGTKQTASGKHRAILSIVDQLVKHGGLVASRNDGAKHEKSACDAVAAALRELDMEPKTFEGVKDLWKKRRAIAPEKFRE